MNLLFNSDTVKLPLKTNGGGEVGGLTLLFYTLEWLNCWWVGGRWVRKKILFRACWKCIFCALGFIHALFKLGSLTKILKPSSCTQKLHSLDLHQEQKGEILDSPCVPHPWIKHGTLGRWDFSRPSIKHSAPSHHYPPATIRPLQK